MDKTRMAIYKCEDCNTCFSTKYQGERVYNICIKGGGTYSRNITADKVKEDARVPSKK